MRLPPGDFPAAGLELLGMPDNRLSSLRLEAGDEAMLYADDGYRGAIVLVRADESCLTLSNFNDLTSSLRIRRVGTT